MYVLGCHLTICLPAFPSIPLAANQLTCPLAVLGTVRPARGSDEAQLTTQNMGIGYGEVVVTDGAPLSLVEDLHAALVVFAGVTRQPELQGAALRRGRGRLLAQAEGQPTAHEHSCSDAQRSPPTQLLHLQAND